MPQPFDKDPGKPVHIWTPTGVRRVGLAARDVPGG